ncbi:MULTISPECIES: hypothetical protein [unclassified Streptomyces]|uniref:Uncharacterized protein n=1 Tax=Streptomyces sp. NBC_00180 TaxID=2903632 RepID=A0AAU1I984_9ACTN|nr:hypothetical protein OG331_04300 [Streptomyces sp. NBC_01017]WSV34749.1 hypothetical protein OG331_47680 [Streptomyces sp. NBC_01017]
MTWWTKENYAGEIAAPPGAREYFRELSLRGPERIPLGASQMFGVDGDWIDVLQDVVVVEFLLRTARDATTEGTAEDESVTCKMRLWDVLNSSSVTSDGSDEFTVRFEAGESGRKCLVIRNFDQVSRRRDTRAPRCLYSIWLESKDENAEVWVSLYA